MRKFIQSVAFKDCYLRVDGTGLTSYRQSGGGHVDCQAFGSEWEFVEIEELGYDSEGRRKVAIKSTAFDNVYLRMYAPKVNGDGGEVNCQYGRQELEEFILHVVRGNRVRFESAAYKGIYLRMDGAFVGQGGGFGWVNASSIAGPYEEFDLTDVPPKLSLDEVKRIIERYGPQLRLYSEEKYQMCSIEFILDHSVLCSKKGVHIEKPTVADLPIEKVSDDVYWLEIEQAAIVGKFETARAYVHALAYDNVTYTEFQFWFCYAYNGPGTVALALKAPAVHPIFTLSAEPFGEHYGDWECCMLRVENRTRNLVSMWLSQHSSGETLNKFEIAKLERLDDAPVVYASNNGHAVFPHTGNNITNLINKSLGPFAIDAGLYNVTGKGGLTLDCRTRFELVATSGFLHDVPQARWLAYPYRWGPTGGRPYDLSKLYDRIMDKLPGLNKIGYVEDLVQTLVHVIGQVVGDNVDGPEGPAQKDQWKGIYD